MNFFSGMSRPVRAAGLGLLAVAVVALGVGMVTLLTGDEGGGDAGRVASPPRSGATSTPSQKNVPASGERTTSAAPSPAAPESTSTAAPPAGGTPASRSAPAAASRPAGGGDGNVERRGSMEDVTVRVYNNSTIKNLASRTAQDLRAQGWNVTAVGNYPWGIIPTTTVYYRPDTPEKAAALSIAAAFGMRAEPRFEGIENASPGVIVIVTKDYTGPVGKTN